MAAIAWLSLAIFSKWPGLVGVPRAEKNADSAHSLFPGSGSRSSSGGTHDNERRDLGPQLWLKKCVTLGFGKPAGGVPRG